MKNVTPRNRPDGQLAASGAGHRAPGEPAVASKGIALIERARDAVLLGSVAAFASLAAASTARAQETPPPAKPPWSKEADAAIAQLQDTLAAPELSFTAKTIRVYLDEFGQPLHIFHTMKVTMRRPDRIKIQVSGDDGAQDLIYDGKSVAISTPEANTYALLAAPGGIAMAANEVLDKLKVDFPLVNFFAAGTEQSLLNGIAGGWQVGMDRVDGVECRHLFFYKRGGTDLELWIENNAAAVPHRLIVTYRLLPGQPSFTAEFTNWDSRVRAADSVFAFQAPAGAKQIELTSVNASAQQGRP